MFKLLAPSRFVFAFLGLAGAALTAQAAFMGGATTQGDLRTQGNLSPPPLSAGVQTSVDAFNNNTTFLGRNEFEPPSPGLDFSYTGGTAVGTPGARSSFIDGQKANPTFGRYNTTLGLTPLPGGFPNPGGWFETSSSLSYQFQGGTLSALSFFGTDFGDFNGSVNIQLMRGTTVVYSDVLSFPVVQAANGTLTFYSISAMLEGDVFDGFRVSLSQAPTGLDVIGLDSMRVGMTRNLGPVGVPEPGSLALVGLALSAAAVVARRRNHC
ncbi:MAG: PEP-CTERM sorting domain-containing protein [Rubrivivax sp.]